MNAMKAGYTLAIRGGTYRTALVVTKSGTPTAPIRITAYNKESVVIDMSGTTWTDAIAVDAKQWIEISGLTTWNASEFGIWVNNSSNIKVSNCDVSYSQHGGVVFQSASNISVRDCAVHHNNQVGLSAAHEAITFENVDTFEVVNCDVYDNKEEGINAKYNSSNGIIAYNRSYRNNGPNIYIDAARSITVVGNMCYDTASSSKTCIGVSVESEWNPNHYPTKDLKIINNVIWGSGGGIWLWTESPNESWSVLSNVRIEYNTIVDNAKNSWGGILFMNGSSSNFSGTNTIRNNIIIGNGGYGIISSNGSILAKFAIANNLFQSGESSTTTGTGAVSTSTSPFVNRTGKNFKLASGAAARGMGLAISDVTTDIDGKARPSSATDVGAYQY